jgi:hypothetical protein
MRRHVHITPSVLSPQRLYAAIADVERWPLWDSHNRAAKLRGPIFHGTRFTLTEKTGLTRTMLIETADAPDRFVVVAILVFARLRVARDFLAVADGTQIVTTIESWGPLVSLWDRAVTQRVVRDCDAVNTALIDFAASAGCGVVQ